MYEQTSRKHQAGLQMYIGEAIAMAAGYKAETTTDTFCWHQYLLRQNTFFLTQC
jgi:hypothetical protein